MKSLNLCPTYIYSTCVDLHRYWKSFTIVFPVYNLCHSLEIQHAVHKTLKGTCVKNKADFVMQQVVQGVHLHRYCFIANQVRFYYRMCVLRASALLWRALFDEKISTTATSFDMYFPVPSKLEYIRSEPRNNIAYIIYLYMPFSLINTILLRICIIL